MPVAGGGSTATHGFLFADLRDYTRYLETYGDVAGAALLERYRALVRGAVAAARGAEIRTEGDSFYVVFDSVGAAVRCGLAIVEAAAASADEALEPIRVGVGIHAGETVETADGYVGSAVNIAARLCVEAKSGEVVVSETVRGLVRTQLQVEFQPLGARRLKGVAEPVACYRVVARGTAPARTRRTRPSVEGRRPWLLAAGLGLAAVAAVGIGAAVLIGGGPAASPSPGPSAAALASPSVAVSAAPGTSAGGSSAPTAPAATPTLGPFPNVVEAAILDALPSAVAKTCVRGGTSDDASLAGFVGKLRPGTYGPPGSLGGVTCGPTTGAKRLYVMSPKDSFWTGGVPADGYLGFLAGHHKLPYGSCATADRAYERWTSASGTGMIACMNPYQGRPWIYFTFGDGRYLAFATRDDADYDALYAWFDQLKTFLP